MTREPHPLTILEKLIAAEAEIGRLKADNRQLENEIADMALGPIMVQNQRAEIERLKAAITWTREVRPGKNAESGGAIVHMTWDQFNTMRALVEPKP